MYPTIAEPERVVDRRQLLNEAQIWQPTIQTMHYQPVNTRELKDKVQQLIGRQLQPGEYAVAIEEQLKRTKREEERNRSFETGYETATPDQILDYKSEEWELVGPKPGVEQKGDQILWRRKTPTANVATEGKTGLLSRPVLQDASAPEFEEKKTPPPKQEHYQRLDPKTLPDPPWLHEFRTKHYEMIELTVEEFYQAQCRTQDQMWYDQHYKPPSAKEVENPTEKEDKLKIAKQNAEEAVRVRRAWRNARVGRDPNGKCSRDV